MKKIVLTIFVLIQIKSFAQFPPAAGQIGSTAINKDSSIFIDWAVTCNISRGYINISDTVFEDPDHLGTNRASYGNPINALGKADNNVVSLGDRGVAILTFTKPIVNGAGYDFAVFENAFDDNFLELAFVEVSSDGINYVRFPSQSLTQFNSQIPAFGNINPTAIHNLAGKYRLFYGTPFDLSDIQDSVGVNINNITHIKIIDVVGSIDIPFCSYDSFGRIINDPFPTPYWTSGFDLDAVGVINNTTNNSTDDVHKSLYFSIYPNPADRFIRLKLNNNDNVKVEIIDLNGKIILSQYADNNTIIDVEKLSRGIYYILINDKKGNFAAEKLIVN